MEYLDLLRRLSQEQGVSGREAKVAESLLKTLHPLVDEVERDRLGNVIAHKKGEGPDPHPRVMLAAHMDEIGLMVTQILEGGFLRFTPVGGIDLRTLPGQEVLIHGLSPLRGVIGAKPPHLQEPGERKKAIPGDELYIDTGYSKKEELEEMVPLGTMVTIERDLQLLANDLVAGKALDNRAGVTVLAACFQELTRLKHRADVYGVATVQEEVGVRGAMVSSYGLAPDLAVVIDVCHGDMPGVAEDEGFPLGKGPALGLGPHVHPRLFTTLKETAQEIGVPYQVEPSPTPAGTDAWAIQIAREGIPTALVSLPLRYMHTAVETLSLKDLKETGRLLAAFIQGLEPAFVEGLSCY
ncbi:MAG: M42 family metallopeptidase [bacterium]|nr:M42 family metallopeptidase [Bacillota bacterium]HHW54302.1 M42 family metallopeptidase [Bacillota bacterium]